MIAATAFFTLMAMGVKALPRIPTYQVVFCRALVSLVSCSWLIWRRGLSPWGNNRKGLLARGVTGTVALLLYFYSLKNLPFANAIAIQQLAPIFTILVTALWLREHASLLQWICCITAFLGATLVRGFDGQIAWLDFAAGVTAAFLAGVAYTLVRKLRHDDHPLVIVLYFPLVTVPIVGTYSLLHWVAPTPIEWLLLLWVGATVTVAQILMTLAYQLEPPSRVSVYNYFGTLYAAAIGPLVFGESLTLTVVCGIILILFGVLFLNK